MARRSTPGVPFFAILLIAVGVVLLLQNFGVIGWELWREIWRFWPLLLVAIGVNIVLRGRLRWLATAIFVALLAIAFAGAAIQAEDERDSVVEIIAEPIEDAKTLELSVDMGLGSLTLNSLPENSTNIYEGSFDSSCDGIPASFNRSGQVATLDVDMEGLCDAGSDWTISMSRNPDVTIDIDSGAAAIDLDLAKLFVHDLRLDVGVADVDIRLPVDAGDVEVAINAGLANIDVWVPEGVEARVYNDSGLSSFDISDRFVTMEEMRRAGELEIPEGGTLGGRNLEDIYVTPGYRGAAHAINVEFDVGLSSISVH